MTREKRQATFRAGLLPAIMLVVAPVCTRAADFDTIEFQIQPFQDRKQSLTIRADGTCVYNHEAGLPRTGVFG